MRTAVFPPLPPCLSEKKRWLTTPPPPLPLDRFLASQLRNVVFAVVAQRAIRRVARDVFEHLHDLDLSYHLAKNTGTVSRIIDRGGKLR